uniref:Uncharacterized protein n=1 Tax=Kalanchoe fedtschenkoi TaxID=63787 RepID=A0A7N0T563_KALFE
MEEKREIKLYCPSTEKLVEYVARNSDRIDLGGIAKIFGLEPATLKINGHFIGRGPDFIASSLTWRALLTFFSHRRLPAGADHRSPLLVHGNIVKKPPANKRTHESLDVEHMIYCTNSPVVDGTDSDATRLSKKHKLANAGSWSDNNGIPNKCCHKRKHFLLEDLCPLNELKIGETESSILYEGQNSAAARNLLSKPLMTHFPTSCLSQKMKRKREEGEEETIVLVTPKRIK